MSIKYSTYSGLSDFQLMVKLACISANYNIEKKLFGYRPERDNTPYSLMFWQYWDSGFDVVEELVKRSRSRGLQNTKNKLWSCISDTFKSHYDQEYQYCLPVTIRPNDFEGLCRSIYLENQITIGDYKIHPNRNEILTDGYGQDGLGTAWEILTNASELIETVEDRDEWGLALQVFTMVNNQRKPDISLYGKYAEKLDYISWSVYDPTYIPLRRRVALGLEL